MKTAEHLSYLFRLTGLLLLTPFYNSNLGKFQVNKLYLSCVFLIFFGYFVLTLYYYTTSLSYKAAGLLFSYLFQIFAIVALQVGGVCLGRPLSNLFKKFDEIARLLQKGFGVRPFKPKYTLLICTLPNLLWFIWTGAFIWRQFDGTLVMLTRRVLHFLITTYLLNSAILQFCFVRHLSAYFERFVWAFTWLKFEENSVKMAAQMHKSLCDAGDLVNDILGWSMLICTVSNCCFALKLVHVMLEFSWSTSFVVYLITKTILCTVSVVVVIVECQRYYNIAKGVRRAVEELQLRWQGQVCKAFSILVQQTQVPMSKITAADFFAMDYSLIFTLVNLMATYIIVILQTSP